MKFGMLPANELAIRARETVSRFPLLTFFLCIGAANHLYMDISQAETFKHISRNIFMSLLLLAPALYSIRFFHESGWMGRRTKLVIDSVSVIAALFYFHYLPDRPLNSFHLSQFTVLFISSILLCFVCIRQGVRDDYFYWNFHAALINRLIITGLYTFVIIGGTSAALGAIDALFKTDLFRNNEIRIIIVTLWIFAPFFFLSGVPILSAPSKL